MYSQPPGHFTYHKSLTQPIDAIFRGNLSIDDKHSVGIGYFGRKGIRIESRSAIEDSRHVRAPHIVRFPGSVTERTATLRPGRVRRIGDAEIGLDLIATGLAHPDTTNVSTIGKIELIVDVSFLQVRQYHRAPTGLDGSVLDFLPRGKGSLCRVEIVQ